MRSLSRRTSASGRIGGTLVAAAALLLPAALLLQAEGAAAQTAEPSEITIYHSLDGADPRPGGAPAGCTPGAAATSTTIDFNDGVSGAAIDDFYAGLGVTFGNARWSSTLGDPLAVEAITSGVVPKINSAIVATFDAAVGEVSILARDVGGNGMRMDAYDAAVGGSVIAFAEAFGEGAGVGNDDMVTVTAAGIQRVEFYQPASGFGDGLVWDDFTLDAVTGGVSEPVCALGGGTDEVLKLWIFGGSENSLEGQTVCAQDFTDIPGEGAGNIIGGTGQEICGAALNFAITGPGRFKGAVRADPYEGDDGIDTLVFGSPCGLANEGEGPECYFPPNLKLLSMNFRTGGSTPSDLARHLVDLIIDTSSWTEGDETEISVGGQGGGAKLQLLTIESETVASLPVPEPTQFVQLLSGLFGLAGLNRLRRKH